MATTRQRVDKDTFKQIFRDHWGPFQQGHPRYQDRHVQAVIDKMLGCGTVEAGYTTYLCPHCLEEKRVAFSCKSSFCFSCCKVYVDEWVVHIGRTLYEGVSYRHVVLTMLDALHLEFYRDRPLLADLMQCGVAMLSDALSWCTKVKLEAGYVVVRETAGRSGHGHPHLLMLMTSGGVTPQQKWREVDYFPCKVLHPTFKGVWSTGANFAPVPLRDTRLGQSPQHHRRADGSPERHAPGSWAYCLRRIARASPA